MGWFDDALKVANPITYLTSAGAQVGRIGGGSGGGEQEAPLTPAQERQKDLDAGYAKGKEIFQDDPDMQRLRAKREDMAKGYDGAELGALRATARGEVAGQREADGRRLTSNLGRGGVGGARGAAIRGATDAKYANMNQENERKMALDSAGMVRSGTNDLQDYIFRQKYGELGTGVAYGQMGVDDRTAAKQSAGNNQPQDRGILGGLLKPFFG